MSQESTWHGRTLVTGGATGIDALAEDLATQHGMKVRLVIPPTHRRAGSIPPITQSMVHEGLQHVLQANKTLQRTLSNTTLKTGLLQRNYWIVRDAHLVVAFAFHDATRPHTFEGGTGWSIQMALDQHKTLYVFTDRWYEYIYQEERFIPCDPSTLHQDTTAIVGTRRMNTLMANALRDLFTRTLQHVMKD